MSEYAGELLFSTGLDDSGLKKALSGLGRKLAGVLSIAAITKFSKACIDLASDLNEVQNVVDVAFPTMNKQIDKFAKNALSSFGLSETAAKKYAGTLGSMAESFRFTEQQSAHMATELTALAGDVASFYNLSADEAYTKLKAVFTGETEGLKSLGVVMTQTALDEYAMEQGLGKTTAKMTEQEKVALRYSFVMKSLSNAQGDFTRNQNSWANQIRILQGHIERLKVSLGQMLIKVILPIVQKLNQALAIAEEFFNLFNEAEDAEVGTSNAAAEMTDNFTEANKEATDLQRTLMGFDKINKLSEAGDSAIAEAGSAIIGSLVDNSGYTMTIGADLDIGDAKKKAEELKKKFDELKQKLEPFYNGVLVPLARFFKETLSGAIQWVIDKLAAFGKWAEENPEKFDRLVEVVLGLVGAFIALKASLSIGNACSTAITAIGKFASSASSSLGTVTASVGGLTSALQMLAGVGTAVLGTGFLIDNREDIFSEFKKLPHEISSIFNDIIGNEERAAEQWQKVQDIEDAAYAKEMERTGGKGSLTHRLLNVPHFANGGYVAANTPRLAVIGDNRTQGEYVLPEDKLAAIAGNNGNSEIASILTQILAAIASLDLTAKVSGKDLTSMVVRIINQQTRATGQCPVIT